VRGYNSCNNDFVFGTGKKGLGKRWAHVNIWLAEQGMMSIVNVFLANKKKTNGTTAVNPLPLTSTGDDIPADLHELKIWESVIEDTIERYNRTLSRMTKKDIKAQLLSLELVSSEKSAIDRLGGPAATVIALYIYPNSPDFTNSCIMLAFRPALASFLSGLTGQTTTNCGGQLAQTGEADLHEFSNVLGYSLAAVIADLHRVQLHFSPPVIMIGNVETITRLARTETSHQQHHSQLLAGTISVCGNNGCCTEDFVLYCPTSVEEITDDRMTSYASISYDLLPRRV